jgi:hypothetical protein
MNNYISIHINYQMNTIICIVFERGRPPIP